MMPLLPLLLLQLLICCLSFRTYGQPWRQGLFLLLFLQSSATLTTLLFPHHPLHHQLQQLLPLLWLTVHIQLLLSALAHPLIRSFARFCQLFFSIAAIAGSIYPPFTALIRENSIWLLAVPATGALLSSCYLYEYIRQLPPFPPPFFWVAAGLFQYYLTLFVWQGGMGVAGYSDSWLYGLMEHIFSMVLNLFFVAAVLLSRPRSKVRLC
jgi:hypothetical protein